MRLPSRRNAHARISAPIQEKDFTEVSKCVFCSSEQHSEHHKHTTTMARAPKETTSDPAANKVAEARARNLDLALQQIHKDYGEGAILRMGEAQIADVAVSATGKRLSEQARGVGRMLLKRDGVSFSLSLVVCRALTACRYRRPAR